MLSLEKVRFAWSFRFTGPFCSSVKHVDIAKGIFVTASPAVLFNELAIVANLLDDDGRISESVRFGLAFTVLMFRSLMNV